MTAGRAQSIGNIKGLLGVRSSGLAVRGARFGLGPTRRTNGPVLGADMQGIDGLRGETSSNPGGDERDLKLGPVRV